jgi:hypothetical protein
MTLPLTHAGPASGQSAVLQGLIGYWALDEVSGNALDSHTNALTLTNNNTVGAGTGLVGGARQFDSASNRFFNRTSETLLQVGQSDAAWAMWVNPDNLTGAKGILSKYAAGNLEWVIYSSGAAALIDASDDGTNTVSVNIATGLVIGSWTWIYCQYELATKKVSIALNNGALSASAALATPGIFAGTRDFKMGSQDGIGVSWPGRIDECGFWKRLLTAAERTSLYNAGAGLAYPFVGA